MIYYTISWIVFCLAASFFLVRDRTEYDLVQRHYWIFILKPWKIVTFLIATFSLIFIAPYTGDPTWDAWDAGFMSVLTFATAPWAIGTLYRIITGKVPVHQSVVLSGVWMFTVSWSYDLYILIRDGHYPAMWLSNIGASSLLYFLAGMLWNLDWNPEKGVTLAFREVGWPKATHVRTFGKIAWFAVPVMALVVAMIGFFFFLYF